MLTAVKGPPPAAMGVSPQHAALSDAVRPQA
jgi:hypothetical protein